MISYAVFSSNLKLRSVFLTLSQLLQLLIQLFIKGLAIQFTMFLQHSNRQLVCLAVTFASIAFDGTLELQLPIL